MSAADTGASDSGPASDSPLGLSGTAASKRPHWAEHLTLGAGDTLNISLFDIPDTARTEIPVGPDGRITFLQASDVVAAGRTIDELRAKLDETLAKYYQNPHTIIVPATFHSKKYFVLGAVTSAGVYTLERPMTVIEALARAGGLQTGLSDQRTVEMADLGHSYLVRDGRHMPVDFERLFGHGDLTQNVALEPDDFLYFASAGANEIYVLGEVVSPGVLLYAPRPTVLKAIAARGGFTDRSFKTRVLVVRGSLNHPETFVVDTSAILKGKEPDFKLQPKDIVYVSKNPWKIGAEVLDGAAQAFVQGMLVEYTTLRVGPLFTKPLIK
jgi:protein involved in polysaccharide export with SLBB domain